MTMNKDGVSASLLLPCPFCGGAATLNHGATDDFNVACFNRECFGPRGPACAFSGDAIAAWNRRAPAMEEMVGGSASCPTCYGTGDHGGNADFGECDDCGGSGVLHTVAALSVRAEPVAELEARAAQLRLRIQELRIDHPEAAERRRDELEGVEAKIAAIRSALAASPAPSIPAGYRLVPEEPTGEWLSRARHWIDRYAAGIDDEPQLDRIYSELPSAPAQQQEGDGE